MKQSPKCGRKNDEDVVSWPGRGARIVPVPAVVGAAVVCILITFSACAAVKSEPEHATEINAVAEANVTENPQQTEGPEMEETPAPLIETEEEALEEASAIHRYELVISDASWSAAFEECLEKGGYLAHMDSMEEYVYITNQIRKEGRTDISFWLGASSDNPTGEYRWISQDKKAGEENLEAPEYLGYWLPGEPSHAGEDEDGNRQAETCMDLLYRSSDDRFYWNDVPEDVVATAPYLRGKFGYICEYEDTERGIWDGKEGNYETLILGEWMLPGSNRMYMFFSPDGTVFGYEYLDDPYGIDGSTLTIDSSYDGERRYFTIEQLDANWLGLVETDSTGMPLNGDEVVYGYRADSPEWYIDPALEIEGYGSWILKDMSDDGVDGAYKGFYFQDKFFEVYYGNPEMTEGGNVDWSMASTGCPGAIIARDGKMDIYAAPGEVIMSYDYRIEGDSLFVSDGDGEHEFIQQVNSY